MAAANLKNIVSKKMCLKLQLRVYRPRSVDTCHFKNISDTTLIPTDILEMLNFRKMHKKLIFLYRHTR